MYRRIIRLASFAVSCILLSISCNEMPVGLEEPMMEDMQEYTITAEVTLPESTRTTMNASFETQWQNSDAVSVFYKQKGKWRNAKFSYSTGKDFKGKLSNPDVNSTWYIQYPYSSSAKSPESSLITVSGNPVQNGYGSNAHLSGSKFPLSGSLTYTGGNNIPSFNLSLDLSITRLTVTNGESSDIVITGVEFTAPQDIVGGFTGDITASGIEWEPTSFNSNTVSLSVRNGSALAPGAAADFYFGIIPLYSVSGEYGLKVYAECAGEDAVSTKQVEHSFTFAPDMINTLTYTFVKDEGPAPEPSTERNLGSFNLVNSNIQTYLDLANSTYSEGNWGSSVITSKTGNDGIYYGKDGDLGDYSASGTPNESQKHTLGSGKTPTGYDYPNPVVIDNLSAYNGSSAVVAVYNNSARTDVENTLTLQVSGGKVNVYNLIPGRTYYYTVSVSGSEVDRGYFATTGERRYLLVQADANIDSSGKITNPYADHANNCRDFGGLKVGNGSQHLKYNLIFRGSNIDLTKNNAAEKETLLGYMGVRLDVDLRKTASSSGDYRDFAKQIHTSYNSETVDWIGPGISGGSDLISTNSTYKTKVENILQSIIDHVVAGKPVYIHCFAGADRTGYICCLLEALLGVSEKDCSIDYELTSFSCVCVRDRAFKLKTGAAMQTCYPYIRDYKVSGVSNPTFQQKANQIVRDLGISQADIDAFKAAMIE